MKNFSGKVAAVTGAGSGIGRALAVELATRGCHVALSDVDDAGLAETVALVEQSAPIAGSVKVTTAHVDVADREAVEAWAAGVMTEFGRVNLIFNNAGVALSANVGAMTYDNFRWLFDINFWGVVHGTLAFLPHLKASGDGHVINISSVFGLLGIPSQSAYNAAKFAVRGFTDALRTELDIEQCGVSATTIHPGGIRTNIAAQRALRVRRTRRGRRRRAGRCRLRAAHAHDTREGSSADHRRRGEEQAPCPHRPRRPRLRCRRPHLAAGFAVGPGQDPLPQLDEAGVTTGRTPLTASRTS